jgi:hypothetical protein
LLENAGLVDDTGKNASLKHMLLIPGRDGYAVALAIGELDPHYEGKSVILAYAGGRSVRDVAAIEVR